VTYGELDALRFKAELEVAQRELEDVSKKAGIAELEWEDQRKQLLATIDGTVLELLSNPIRLLILIIGSLHFAARDAELNQLKMLVEQLADKVNARGDTPAERLAAMENMWTRWLPMASAWAHFGPGRHGDTYRRRLLHQAARLPGRRARGHR
jgi:hypothetical protein